MRIAISGTACQGKSTLIDHFLRKWPMYKTSQKTYRDIVNEYKKNNPDFKIEEIQLLILDCMTKELKEKSKEKYQIYDRCPWDNLAYTLHANENNQVSDEITAASIDIVKASLKDIDIIFWIKYNPNIKIVDNGIRNTNLNYIQEIDRIFSDLYDQYADHLENTPFYIADNCPAIIPVDALHIDDRIAWIGEFIDKKGDLIETQQSVLAPENLDLMEQMLKDQGLWAEKDNQFKNLTKEIKNFKI